MADLKLSVQLYTLRDAVDDAFAGVMNAVRGIGFTAVELAGYGSLKTAAAVRVVADAAGLRFSGARVGLHDLEHDFATVVKDQATLGNTEVIIPWLDEARRKPPADWVATAGAFDRIGKRLAKEGLGLSYHNHAFEFDPYDGQTGMNLLLQHTDPAVVGCEVDVYWVKHGGHDPVQFLESLGSRLRLVHLKDRTTDGKFAAVGTGTLDFPSICRTAGSTGALWGVVEQDDCYGQDPLDVLRTGYATLERLGYA